MIGVAETDTRHKKASNSWSRGHSKSGALCAFFPFLFFHSGAERKEGEFISRMGLVLGAEGRGGGGAGGVGSGVEQLVAARVGVERVKRRLFPLSAFLRLPTAPPFLPS